MASMAIINVECDLITGFYGSVKPGMISIYHKALTPQRLHKTWHFCHFLRPFLLF